MFFFLAGAGANILRAVAGAGALALYDKSVPFFLSFVVRRVSGKLMCIIFLTWIRFQELAWGKVYAAGSG